ncbi:MAG TPA: 2-isopropylmalate synthase, partial [Victivallales bacterium]|nr:2-isopropylmalate synthase [Victivallales bacterium]
MKKEIKKYSYPSRIPIKNRHWPDNIITKSPTWCSVDLRDGNQALPIPMTPERKISYFKMLCSIGFKEIEIGFPSASQDDYDFTRLLIEKKKIPDDIRISVLTQAREHLVAKTVQALKGVKEAILHCYVAASDLHAQLVFNKKREEVMEMSVKGTELVIKYLEAENMLKNISYEFSPEEFTDSDLDFVISLSEAVYETWRSKSKKQFILNLPATVERRPPYQYADMIEYFISKYKYSKDTIISVHAHNDQGCAVAATEMALLAGAQRVEGTLFGHGERTGNVDIVTLSLNLHSRGINTGLNFKNMNSIVKVVEESSGIPVHPRHPYAGSLVFTAFSGSHQDAIRKGLAQKEKAREIFGISWKIPYLHIDPADIGRKYEKIIKINSQS